MNLIQIGLVVYDLTEYIWSHCTNLGKRNWHLQKLIQNLILILLRVKIHNVLGVGIKITFQKDIKDKNGIHN